LILLETASSDFRRIRLARTANWLFTEKKDNKVARTLYAASGTGHDLRERKRRIVS